MAGQSKFPSDLQLPRDLELRLEDIEKSVKAAELQIQEIGLRELPKLEFPMDLEARIERLDKAAEALQIQIQQRLRDQPNSSVNEELVLAVASLKEDIARINNRIIKIEEFLTQITGPSQTPRVRVLKQR
jgi:ABC-type histidine transport system ATPase subunit